jgi:hypothetical protein
MEDKLNSDKIWKIQKKIVKRYDKYGRKVGWIVKRYGQYGRKASWIVIRYISFHISTCLSSLLSISYHYSTYFSSIWRKVSRIVIRYGQQGRKASWNVKWYEKYGR